MPSGVFRVVFLVGDFAIKLPQPRNFLKGMRCNRWEREMWNHWQPIFQWETLCPVCASDPFGFFIVMPRAAQPVREEEIDALPDYYPSIDAELKPENHGHQKGTVLILDYGLDDQRSVNERRNYYSNNTFRPAIKKPKDD